MNASLHCSERLLDAREETCTDCVLLFHQPLSKTSFQGLGDSYNLGSSYLPIPTYALTVQNCETFCRYREHTFMWMLGICRDKGSHPSVAYTGMNYFDRYLSRKVIPKDQLELLSWLCIHVASSLYDNRYRHLSFSEICSVISDTYPRDAVKSFLYDLLIQLDFKLNPYSPYLAGGALLERTHNTSLYPNLQSLLNGICMKYDSLTIPPQSITHVCIALAWAFSYPKRELPESLNASNKVTVADVEKIVRLVQELFPMMREACMDVIKLYGSKAQHATASPTSIVTNSH